MNTTTLEKRVRVSCTSFILGVLTLLNYSNARAQGFQFGIQTMFVKPDLNITSRSDFTIGVGVFAEYAFKSPWVIHTELNYTQMNPTAFNLTVNDNERLEEYALRLRYLEVPVSIGYRLTLKNAPLVLTPRIGAYWGYAVSGVGLVTLPRSKTLRKIEEGECGNIFRIEDPHGGKKIKYDYKDYQLPPVNDHNAGVLVSVDVDFHKHFRVSLDQHIGILIPLVPNDGTSPIRLNTTYIALAYLF